jgi:hypothetical protein
MSGITARAEIYMKEHLMIAIQEVRKINVRDYTYQGALEASDKINWKIEDIIGGDKRLDFSRPFMPESLARAEQLDFLTPFERFKLNQIRGHAYLSIFGVVEEFILPFILDFARPSLSPDDYKTRAFLKFAGEEAKHIHLFKQFRDEFRSGFGVDCAVIGPPEAIAKAILAHDPLGIALAILHIEWMVQAHYVESVKDAEDLDPQFKSLLRHHWLEESQHAKLDTLMVESIVRSYSESQIAKGFADYASIGAFIDGGLKQQTVFDLEALERATSRKLTPVERDQFIRSQVQANRYTYLYTGMTHPNFLDTVGRISPEARKNVENMSAMFM